MTTKFGAALVLVTAITIPACAEGGRSNRFLSIGTGGTGGVYYPIGGALASRLSIRDSTRTYTAEVTGGSVENIQRVANGEMDLAFAIGTTVYEAYNGGQDFAAPVSRLRVVAPLYPNVTHVLVRDGAGIGSIAEFRGKRVSVGAPGSGTEQVARQVLEAAGLTYDDVNEQYLSFTESAAALADGALDAAILSVGFPASAVLEATTTGRVRLLPIGAELMAEVSRRYPYYIGGSIPAGSYPRHNEAIPTVAVMNWMVGRDDLDPTVVQSLLDILNDEMATLRQSVEIAAQIDLANLATAPIPLHDAAEAWRVQHAPGN
jgi:TRAP transporter TAXI family solute receptor